MKRATTVERNNRVAAPAGNLRFEEPAGPVPRTHSRHVQVELGPTSPGLKHSRTSGLDHRGITGHPDCCPLSKSSHGRRIVQMRRGVPGSLLRGTQFASRKSQSAASSSSQTRLGSSTNRQSRKLAATTGRALRSLQPGPVSEPPRSAERWTWHGLRGPPRRRSSHRGASMVQPGRFKAGHRLADSTIGACCLPADTTEEIHRTLASMPATRLIRQSSGPWAEARYHADQAKDFHT